MPKALFALLLLLFTAATSLAQQAEPRVSAALNYQRLHAGQQAVLAVVVEIPQGLHSQSSTPTAGNFVAFALQEITSNSASAMAPVYPPGEDVEYPALGKLNVYSGRVVAYVPLTINQGAPPGDLTVSGKLQIQLCDDQTCFRPFRGKTAIPFTASAQIARTSEPAVPANEDLFAGFDPRVFASAGTAEPVGKATDIQVFGWSFQLRQSAYLLAFVIAFLVGIIFNLMPCVLPVVPLKAIGFYEASQHNRARCFLLGVVFSAGLLAMFAALAALVIVGGAAWGELFARGWFVWSIVTILTIMAAGQLGAFAVVLPNTVYSFVPSHNSLLGNFLFGGFTAILSTPCTAPMFLGLLVWASGQPKWLGVSTVMMVGVGMAFPYLVLAAVPELARKMPRTGPWSELVKQFMAFLLLAVAAYFAAGRLLPGNAFLWVVFAIVAIGCLFLVLRTWMLSGTSKAVSIATTIALLIGGGTFWFARTLNAGTHELIAWQPYSAEALQAADGEVVMLEFTANWCANCKELESRVFRDPRTAEAIERLKVVPMRADLTLDDAPGWEKLREISKSGGIPLTLIYSPNLKRPIQLASIYSTDNLVQALEKAAVGVQ